MNVQTTTRQNEIGRLLDPKIAMFLKALPIKKEEGHLVVAVPPGAGLEMKNNLEACLGCPIRLEFEEESQITRKINQLIGMGGAYFSEVDPNGEKETAEIEENDGAMIRFVNDLLDEAISRGATDVHFEPEEKTFQVRFRIDGLLKNIPLSESLQSRRFQLASRIKIMARLNIAERRLPQDGHFSLTRQGRDYDVRVSTLPGLYGEIIALRLLSSDKKLLSLPELGLTEEEITVVEKALRKPHGLVLATGPTGHGKTTTLFAFLSKIFSPEKKIMTIEDPVEIRLKGVRQIQVQPEIGLTFHQGLRSILRQDPDILMIGEIRDEETARIATRAALTGRLVFSTLHANDAISAALRLKEMGVAPYLVAASLTLVVGQRLPRRLCPPCAAQPNAACQLCEGTGLFGRTGIFETFPITEEIGDMIQQQRSRKEIKLAAQKQGYRTLKDKAMEAVQEKRISLNEAVRVTGE